LRPPLSSLSSEASGEGGGALMPPPVLVLGLGNDILSDDAAGLRVAAAVSQRLVDASF
jgi:hypothetical protein